MHWETKTFMWLVLLQNSLYYDDQEPNPQYLKGVPILLSRFQDAVYKIPTYEERTCIRQEEKDLKQLQHTKTSGWR